jgi:hypothetical protein
MHPTTTEFDVSKRVYDLSPVGSSLTVIYLVDNPQIRMIYGTKSDAVVMTPI